MRNGRKRLQAAILVLALILGLAGPAHGEESTSFYVWNLEDRERVTQSSGTGGAQPVESVDWQPEIKAAPQRDYKPRPIDLSVYPQVERLVREWLEDSADEPVLRNDQGWGYSYGDYLSSYTINGFRAWVHGRVLTVVYERDTACRVAHFDLLLQKRLFLSDFFYDGVNYIDFINLQLLRVRTEDQPDWDYWGIDRTYYYDNDDDEGWDSPRNKMLQSASTNVEELVMRRPFSGFPRDYPFFYIRDDKLLFSIDEANPFFSRENGLDWIELSVPLPHWLSPYGSCTMALDYEKMTAPDLETNDIPLVRLDEGRYPQAEAKINDEIRGQFLKAATAYAQWKDRLPQSRGFPLSPAYYAAQGYVSVSFVATPPYSLTMETGAYAWNCSSGVYNIHTGEPLPLADILARWPESGDATFYREVVLPAREAVEALYEWDSAEDYDQHPESFSELPEQVFCVIAEKDAAPPENCVPLNAFFRDSWRDDTLIIRLQAPDGDIWRMEIPLKDALQTLE